MQEGTLTRSKYQQDSNPFRHDLYWLLSGKLQWPLSGNKTSMSSLKRMKFKGRIKTYWTAYCTSCSWSDRTITPISAIFPTCSEKQHRWQNMLGQKYHKSWATGFPASSAILISGATFYVGEKQCRISFYVRRPSLIIKFLIKIKNSVVTFPAATTRINYVVSGGIFFCQKLHPFLFFFHQGWIILFFSRIKAENILANILRLSKWRLHVTS